MIVTGSTSNEKQLTTAQTNPPPRLACFSVDDGDKLRLVSFPDDAIDAVRAAINKAWSKGIQEERDYYEARQFKMRGNPWYGYGNDVVPSRTLMCTVLSSLFALGWVIDLTTSVGKNWDKDRIIFRFQSPPLDPCVWFSVSFNRFDILRLIEVPEDLILPLRKVLGESIQKDGWKEAGTYEFKLVGLPWATTGRQTVSTSMLLLRIISTLESQGFTIYASIDQSTQTEQSEADTWYCYRPTSWTSDIDNVQPPVYSANA